MKLNAYWEGYIVGLSDANVSLSVIVKRCSDHGLVVSKAGVSKIIRRCKQQLPEERGGREKWRRNRPQPSRKSQVVQSIRTEVQKENPPTQRSIAKKMNTSQTTVWRIIHDNLGFRRCYKARGHKLTEKHVQERKTNARKLYENYLAGDKWQWVVSLDEAWIYLDDTNKPRAIYYRHKDSKGRGNFVKQCKEKFLKGFMIVAGYCARGQLRVTRVGSKTKVNSRYFQEEVMEHLYSEDIPRLYGDEASKVWVHMDKASSHTSKSSIRYYEKKEAETGISVIPFSSVPVKSPDASPMDFCGFGLLKRALAKRRPRTVQGLWKVCQEEWYRIPLQYLRRSLLQWKLRCRAIAKNHGYHIEHCRWWRHGISQ